MPHQSSSKKDEISPAAKHGGRTKRKGFADHMHFIRSWVGSPRNIGAVMPSGPVLAQAMARCVRADGEGMVVELGPGTGPVTVALLAKGIAPERLVLVEYDAEFCALLRKRFPKTTVIQGDAYNLSVTLKDLNRPITAVVSSLPLLTRPEEDRVHLLDDAFGLMGEQGMFIQFTYGLKSPMPLKKHARLLADYHAERSFPIWRNVPPARVWRYSLAKGDRLSHPPMAKGKV